MATFTIDGTITYGNKANRDTVLTAVNAAVANYPTVTGSSRSSFGTGVGTSGNTILTLAYEAPDRATAEALNNDLVAALTGATRTAVYLGVTRVGGT